MDDALVLAALFVITAADFCVLILVLMDDALVPVYKTNVGEKVYGS